MRYIGKYREYTSDDIGVKERKDYIRYISGQTNMSEVEYNSHPASHIISAEHIAKYLNILQCETDFLIDMIPPLTVFCQKNDIQLEIMHIDPRPIGASITRQKIKKRMEQMQSIIKEEEKNSIPDMINRIAGTISGSIDDSISNFKVDPNLHLWVTMRFDKDRYEDLDKYMTILADYYEPGKANYTVKMLPTPIHDSLISFVDGVFKNV